ncbi:hypothetical protein KUTeg_014540 [Tegillarca granosa]|uniref:Uncharacterized protein n=1 Tax=Tegillarca granosa TaxID=220873 RepID=A0ABQ9ERQ0_TEGGR|nr:hypothetical protein KUTeg_014540 [Tegillarca granosa]
MYTGYVTKQINEIYDQCMNDFNDNPGGPITTEEAQYKIKNLKHRKTPGNDLIDNKHLIHGVDSLTAILAKLLNDIIKV